LTGVASAAAIGLGAARFAGRASAQEEPWIEVYEIGHRQYHIDAGGFPPGHQIVVGAFRPAPGPPPVPSGPGSHWFAGHIGPFADQYGMISINYTVSSVVKCNQMLPFIACDEDQINRCLDWNGPIGQVNRTVVTPEPSYNFLTCPRGSVATLTRPFRGSVEPREEERASPDDRSNGQTFERLRLNPALW
jgi:hypothetical protein